MRLLYQAFQTLLVLSYPIEARALDLWVWKPGADQPEILIPREDEGASPRDALRAYLKAVDSDSDLRSMPRHTRSFGAEAGTLSPFRSRGAEPGVRFGVFANEFTDLGPLQGSEGSRIGNLTDKLAKRRASLVVVPVAADLHLSPGGALEYRRQLDAGFDALLALGGNHIDPSLYAQERRFSVEAHPVHPVRDRSEIEALRWSITKGKAAVFGICRGHQACAIASGHELIQDIPSEIPGALNHRHTWHDIRIKKGSFLDKLFGVPVIRVNSIHEQAVLAKDGSRLRPAAESAEGAAPILEAAEFAEGRGFTLQFHPELMEDETGARILDEMVRTAVEWRQLRMNGCSAVFAGIHKPK